MRDNLRRGRLLLLALVFGMVLSGSALAQTRASDADTRQKTEPQKPPQAQTEELSGIFTAHWVDPRPDFDGKSDVEYALTDAQGQETELVLDEETAAPSGGPLSLNGERVSVEGRDLAGDSVGVQVIRPEGPDTVVGARMTEAAVTGSRPTATILCRFADSAGVTPQQPSFFTTLMGNSRPGMDHYWRESSYGNINLANSRVFGWYNLPDPASSYKVGAGMNEDKLAEDCTARAEADVFFPNFTNVNVMVNTSFINYALGGTHVLNRDGQNRAYGFTWMPRWGYQREATIAGGQYILAHEMGHSFGLPHSSGPYSQTYDSEWDVMSDGSICSPQDTRYGCLAVHTISAHKDRLGWIPTSRKYTAVPGNDNQNVTIERLSQPGSANYLMARIPIAGSSTRFYTVEARRLVGYDNQTPGEAIVIHKVDTTNATGLTPIAKVVDPDNNGDPNDAGAQWTSNETFTDAANQISVTVTRATTSGYNLRINTGILPPDTTPPSVALTSHSWGQIVRFGETLAADATDDRGVVNRVEFLVNGSVVGTASAPPFSVGWNSQSVRDGYATIAARAFDAAGNAATSAGQRVIVDNTYPQTLITSGPPRTTRSTRAILRFVSSESSSTFRCKLDRGPWKPCASPKAYGGLSIGTHTFQVYAIGAAGDRDLTPAVRRWKVVR